MNPQLKTISYRGGVLSFCIPAAWQEEYEPDGGASFFTSDADSPTFRLEVITVKSPSELSVDDSPDVLAALGQSASGSIERLPTGCALSRYTQSTVDRGHHLFITYWSVAHVIPPDHARIATFSYTLLDRQRSDVRYQSELDLLDREVRASTFSLDLGAASQ